jgi:hypothetical protein
MSNRKLVWINLFWLSKSWYWYTSLFEPTSICSVLMVNISFGVKYSFLQIRSLIFKHQFTIFFCFYPVSKTNKKHEISRSLEFLERWILRNLCKPNLASSFSWVYVFDILYSLFWGTYQVDVSQLQMVITGYITIMSMSLLNG